MRSLMMPSACLPLRKQAIATGGLRHGIPFPPRPAPGRDLATTSAGFWKRPSPRTDQRGGSARLGLSGDPRFGDPHPLPVLQCGSCASRGLQAAQYRTAYDALVERSLQEAFDQVLEQEPRLTFALILDLNSYAPSHNKVFSKDWTGRPDKDLAGNRVNASSPTTGAGAGARHGLGRDRRDPPGSVSRGDFQGVADLAEKASEPRGVSGADLCPGHGLPSSRCLRCRCMFCGQRYGACLLGWSSEG